MEWPLKTQGRYLSEVNVDEVKMLLQNHPNWHRTRLSKELCKRWNWYRPDGQIKDIACRELLRKLEQQALIKLPLRLTPGGGSGQPKIEPIDIDQSPITCLLSEIKPISVINIKNDVTYEKSFNYLMKEYHYLSYSRPVGQNMKYMILGKGGCFLGGLLFGACAWKMEARDKWIGWSSDQRERNLGLICNNTRFLIFNWVNIPNLASYVLGTCLGVLHEDWKRYYGTEIVLVETFVDTMRYKGICYKAANWVKIGQTKGRGRQDKYNRANVSVKDIYVYPLFKDFQNKLLK